ncbi:MAG: cysteine--tRNA ligase [Dehalococcoidales bacterium]|nr:cysteine--tRNA ligase [Dehalococcoidales bacterium]
MKVYNTISGQKEDFLPRGDEVKMYVCGVTPYDEAHIGHAMSYIIFDVVRRYLKYRGYKVKYVQNITDIDDKIIDRANRLGISTQELAGKYSSSFFEDMDALNIKRADVYPRATEEIPRMIEVIQGLIDKGFAYPALVPINRHLWRGSVTNQSELVPINRQSEQGSVYFRVSKVSDYGKLSHRSLESMMSAEGAIGAEEKEHPMDFVLWKAAKPGEPSWESPWGKGRPGWHIECSAMSLRYLGEAIDIHGGGQDLVFPHHENEIAQSESFTGVKPFVKYWMHNGFLQFGGEKMSKSLGNLITIKQILEKYSADAIRIFVLSSHYRSPLTYDEITLEARGVALRAFSDAKWKLSERYSEMNRSILEAQGIKTDDITPAEIYRNRFISAMDDDFNTAQAIATLFNLAQGINHAVNLGHEDKVDEHRKIFIKLANVLGLVIPEPETKELPLNAEDFMSLQKSIIAKVHYAKLDGLIEKVEAVSKRQDTDSQVEVYAYIQWLTDFRDDLRRAKQFRLADEIRTKLDELGIALEDTPQGTVWRRKR